MNLITLFQNFSEGEKITTIVATLTAISGTLEKIFKFKFLWNWVLRVFKAIAFWFRAPYIISRQQAEMRSQLNEVINEVKFNGGKYTLKTVVGEIRQIVDQLIQKAILSQSSLRGSLYVSPTPIIITDADGRLLFSNAAFGRYVQCMAPQEMNGYGWMRVVEEDEKESVQELFEEVKSAPYPFSRHLTIVNWSNGEHIKSYCRGTVVTNGSGQVVEVICAFERIFD